MGYIAPEFLEYDKDLARTFTVWLYGDPAANPRWDNEAAWPKGPRIAWVKRTVAFETVTGTVQSLRLDQLFGGKNAIIFSAIASVTDDDALTEEQLPNTRAGYVLYRQAKSDGTNEVEESPINNVFGTIPGQPKHYALPKLWYGPDARDFFVRNVHTTEVDVTLSFLAAVLDTGR